MQSDGALAPTAMRPERLSSPEVAESLSLASSSTAYPRMHDNAPDYSPSNISTTLLPPQPAPSALHHSNRLLYNSQPHFHEYLSPPEPANALGGMVMSENPTVPSIFDSTSLRCAVNHDPEAMFYTFCNMASSRDQAIRDRDEALRRVEKSMGEADDARYQLQREEEDHYRTKETLGTVKSQLNDINKEFISTRHKFGYLDLYKDDLKQKIYDLKAELTSSEQNHRGARKDHQYVLELCQSLQHINDAKAVVMWKFIDRLQGYIAHLREGGDPDPNFESMMKWQISQSQGHESAEVETLAHTISQDTVVGRPDLLDHRDFPELGVQSTNTLAVSESDRLSDVSTIVPLDGSDGSPSSPSRTVESTRMTDISAADIPLPSKEPQVGVKGPPQIPTYAQAISNKAARQKPIPVNSQPRPRDSSTETSNKALFNPSAVRTSHHLPTSATNTISSQQTFIPITSPTKISRSAPPTTRSSSSISNRSFNPHHPSIPITLNTNFPATHLPHRPTGVLLLPPNPHLTTNSPHRHQNHHQVARSYAQDLRIEIINLSLSTLPHKFANICPFSLISLPCSLPTCTLRKLCEAYNDESSPNTECDKANCGDVHLYKTCLTEIDGCPNECVVFQTAKDGDDGDDLMKRDWHLRKRVHFEGCEGEEWKARRVLADLREVHRLGRWGGRC
jgi:hypothetical protein